MVRRSTGLRAGEIDLAEWRWLLGALRARFDTGSFGAGAALVAAVAEVAEEAGHPPDADLRAGHVQFALRDRETGEVTPREVRLAERITALASERGLTPRPERVQVLELALDTPVSDAVRPFWTALLAAGEVDGEVVDPAGGSPTLWFQKTDSTAPDRQRFHLDVVVPPETAEARIASAVSAGGRVVDDSRAPTFVVLADRDGNQACVCTELGRD